MKYVMINNIAAIFYDPQKYGACEARFLSPYSMSSAMNTLARLQAWYAQQCNGEWEHSSGISIQSCDNPGWWVKINLEGTPLQALAFTEIAQGVDAQRFALGPEWLCCHTENGIWHGAGDATRLGQILEIFLAWVEANGRSIP